MTSAIEFLDSTVGEHPSNQCPWFQLKYRPCPGETAMLLALADGECVAYAIYDVFGDAVDLQYVENAPNQHGRGYARLIVNELIRRYPSSIFSGAATHVRSPNLLRKTGFSHPDDVAKMRPDFPMKGVWVRFPPSSEARDDADD